MPTGAPDPGTDQAPADEEVLVRRAGHLGHLVLSRPRALNALTLGMIETVRERLAAWGADGSVRTVLLTGAGERGLCAGGDLRAVHSALAADRPEDGDAVFHAEYGMNLMTARVPKPFVAVMDGIVLGGGVGISGHSSHRIVTERTRLGMPETAIGFFPDVGVAHLLARAPFRAGLHLALTGEHITGADAIALGLADHYVPSARLESLARALETEPADDAIAAVAEEPPAAPLLAQREWIESCYAAGTAEEIVAALRDHGDPAAGEAARRILAGSPTSVTVTLAHVREAEGRSLPEVLRTDYRLSSRLLRAPDFPEGVRAVLLDKDRDPAWRPATLEQVTDEAVAAAFAPLPDGELELPDGEPMLPDGEPMLPDGESTLPYGEPESPDPAAQ